MNKRIKKKIISRHRFHSIKSYKKFKKEFDKVKRLIELINYECTKQFLREYAHIVEMLRKKENENKG